MADDAPGVIDLQRRGIDHRIIGTEKDLVLV
jgi:hypothetical protein